MGSSRMFSASLVVMLAFTVVAGLSWFSKGSRAVQAAQPMTISFTNTDYVRNGDFSQDKTAWAMNFAGSHVGNYGPDSSKALQIWPDFSSNQGFAFQELYLPTQIDKVVLSFDYRFEPQQGAAMDHLKISLWGSSSQDMAVAVNITPANYPGTGWQQVNVTLDAATVAKLNTARANGEKIYFYLELVAQFLYVDLDNVSLKLDGSMSFPSLSGDVAFVALDASGNTASVERINPDGSGRQTVWTHSGNQPQLRSIYDVAWKPDGTELAIASNHESGYSLFHSDIFAVAPDGSNMRRITNPPSKADIDAGKFAFGAVTGRILNRYKSGQGVLLYLEGAKEPVSLSLGSFDTETNFTVPNVADMGTGMNQLFAIRFSASDGTDCIQHVIAPAVDVVAGSTVNVNDPLTFDGSCGRYNPSHLTWKGDGSEIGFLLSLLPRRANAAGEALGRDLLPDVTGANSLAWDPTSDRILYNKLFGSGESIYLTTAGSNGEGTRLDVAVDASEANPAWLPDGSGFVFTLGGAAGVGADRIGYYDLNSNTAVTLTQVFNESVAGLSVSPDGKYIVFGRGNSDGSRRDLWVMNRLQPNEMWPLTNDGRSINPDWSRKEPQNPAPATSTPTATLTATPTATSTPNPNVTPSSWIYLPATMKQ